MRNLYDWYLPLDDAKIESIWTTGILTVDTNVLLDLYRYHNDTREQILQSIERFKGRVWLTHQVADEFIRNRTGVIAQSANQFKIASESLDILNKAISTAREKLSGIRLMPRPMIEALGTATDDAIRQARDAIRTAEIEYPNYFRSDPILDRVLVLFNNAVGQEPTTEQRDSFSKEGARRVAEKIPPGFLDKAKDGNRPQGDYILWKQILDHAKSKALPIIFVTSEKSEDWWEVHSGKTIGPRRELLLEASQVAAQRVLIYQTEQFVKFAAERAGQQVKPDVVTEIRDIGSQHDYGQAVTTVQAIETKTSQIQTGLLMITLTRELQHFTGSGRLAPRMDAVPDVYTELLESPAGAPSIRERAGTGTTFDFHVHLISNERERPLPVGDYVVRYVAQCEPRSARLDMATPIRKDVMARRYGDIIDAHYVTVRFDTSKGQTFEDAVEELRREAHQRVDLLQAAIRRADAPGAPWHCKWDRKTTNDPWVFEWMAGAEDPNAPPPHLV